MYQNVATAFSSHAAAENERARSKSIVSIANAGVPANQRIINNKPESAPSYQASPNIA